jgi:hypothetical protein
MLRRFLTLSALVLCVALPAATARADDAAEETVRLRNGDLFRGALVERVVGDHVTLHLATGELMRFPWSALAPSETAATLVRIEADDPRAVLSHRTGTGLTLSPYGSRAQYGTLWEDVCAVPCEREVDSTRTYRIEGEGVWPSGAFRLRPGPETLHVKTGSRGGLVAGLVLTVIGGTFALNGGVFAAVSTIPVDTSAPNVQEQRQTRNAFLAVGVVQLVLGVVGLGVGIPLWASNTTTVTDDTGQTIGALRGCTHAPCFTPAGIAF